MMEKKDVNKRINAPIPLRPEKNAGANQLSRDEMRSKKKKKLKRRRKIRKIIFSVLLIAVLVALGILLAFTVFFKIETITVDGTKTYSQTEIVESSGVEPGDSLLSASAKSIAAALTKALPYVGSVSIERQLPATLVIHIEETEACATVKNSNGTYILIDENGKVLDTDASAAKKNISRLSGVKVTSPTDGEKIKFSDEARGIAVLKLLKVKKNAGLTNITAISVKDLSNIILKYDGRIKVKIGTVSDIETKLIRAKAALEKEDETNKYSVGTLDLRTDPYAYFNPGEDDTTRASKEKTTKTAS